MKKTEKREGRVFVGDALSFSAQEAYKLLRTNISFCDNVDASCQVIGITSSLAMEGKTTLSLNLAYFLAKGGKRVCLIEGDMRLPNIARAMKVPSRPGLSDLLAGKANGNEVLKRVQEADGLWIIPCGSVPPNPSELLGSRMMEETLRLLSPSFDYILVDLPPLGEVADALAVSSFLHGMVLVVRQDYCEKKDLENSIRLREISGVRILGLVLTQATASSRHEKYYKSYYKSARSASRAERGSSGSSGSGRK